MQVIHPDLFGDLGDQILSTDLIFGIRRPVDDRSGHLARNAPATDLPEFEYVSLGTDDETTKLYISFLTEMSIREWAVGNGLLLCALVIPDG